MDLRTIRVLKNLSQWHLQNMSGVVQSRISLAERGLIHLNDAEKKALEKALDVPGGIQWGKH